MAFLQYAINYQKSKNFLGSTYPAKEVLIDYYVRAYQSVETVMAELKPEMYDAQSHGLFLHLSHTNRHLGMIEALRGAQGMIGTATN